ncbi:class I SAM-dependent methyltransferase [Candidatus Gottesmanbacteria bacterium]|nr:class I SAM-dependent methyltransferase [Candidatus Gottesmanbacteria bacterium]
MQLFQSTTIIDHASVNHFIEQYARQDNWHEIDKTSGNLGYGWIHYALIRILKPERVLCIGSRYGFIPAICALACRDNKKGIVDFVDANYDQNDPEHNTKLGGKHDTHWGGVGFWTPEHVKNHFHKFKLNEHIRMTVATSRDFHRMNPTQTWQYIHLDGDHSYQGIKTDVCRFFPKLTSGGMLTLHDIRTKHAGGLTYGVWQLWREMKAGKQYNCIELPGSFGLGLTQK